MHTAVTVKDSYETLARLEYMVTYTETESGEKL